MDAVEEAVQVLRAKEASMRCSELTAVLEGVGLAVVVGSKGKHRTVEHPVLDIEANFDGGHGRDSEVKKCYVREMRKLLEKYHDQLVEFLEHGND